jgi:hypothetical protein
MKKVEVLHNVRDNKGYRSWRASCSLGYDLSHTIIECKPYTCLMNKRSWWHKAFIQGGKSETLGVRTPLILRLYFAVLHSYSAILHLYSAVLHRTPLVLHLYSAVLHSYATVLHSYSVVLHRTPLVKKEAGCSQNLGVQEMQWKSTVQYFAHKRSTHIIFNLAPMWASMRISKRHLSIQSLLKRTCCQITELMFQKYEPRFIIVGINIHP